MYNPVICEAIKDRRVLQITYERKIRLIEPHAYGIDEEHHELLRAWQQLPLPDDWRTFRLDKTTGTAITANSFLAAASRLQAKRFGHEEENLLPARLAAQSQRPGQKAGPLCNAQSESWPVGIYHSYCRASSGNPLQGPRWLHSRRSCRVPYR
jgi:predicted DNA-binding transcriptional regulator YafY